MSKNQSDFFKHKNDWSEIKDRLLQGYLPQYFQKLLTSNRTTYYVDCFAGKGKFDDGKSGSPLIALEIIDNCLRQSKTHPSRDRIKTCFIELNYAVDLKKNISSFPHICEDPEIISGKFEENIRGKLKGKRGQNVFLYIDPYGIKALDSSLFYEFQTYGFASFEMLINFNSFGFFRDACRALKVDVSHDEAFQSLEDLVEYDPSEVQATQQSQNLLTTVAGGDYWKAIVNDYNRGLINGYQAERRLSTEYKQHLKQKYTYVLDMPICFKPGQRPKYRMIHVCDHQDGCFLMAENMQRRKDELFTNIQQGGQLSLFDITPEYTSTVEGDILTESDIEAMVKASILHSGQDTRITEFLAKFCNEYGVVCPFSMIHTILGKFESNGEINIIREPALSKTGASRRFWDEKDGKKVIIRRHLG